MVRSRVAGHEVGHRRAEVQHAEGHRRVDLENALGLVVQARDLQLGFLHLGQDGDAALVVGEARLGGRDAPRGAVEQAGAERPLQLHDRLADGRAGQAQAPAGLGEAARRHHLGERVHGVELVHIVSIWEPVLAINIMIVFQIEQPDLPACGFQHPPGRRRKETSHVRHPSRHGHLGRGRPQPRLLPGHARPAVREEDRQLRRSGHLPPLLRRRGRPSRHHPHLLPLGACRRPAGPASA